MATEKTKNIPLRIGIDVDDVLVDFISAFRQEAETVLNRRFPLPPGSWSFKNWKVTQADIEKVWDRIKKTDNWFYYNCVALPYVAENLPWLVENYDVYFITARIPTAGFSVQKQVQLHLNELGIEFPTVIAERDKGPICAALKLDVFIDDRIENLLSVVKASEGRTKVFVMNQSHNTEYQGPVFMTRVNNFGEFISKIQEMK